MSDETEAQLGSVGRPEFGPPSALYPAEQRFEPPPPSTEPEILDCQATYGLLIAHGFTLLRCARPKHDMTYRHDGRACSDNSWHAAPLLDGNFRWPPGAVGAPDL